MSDRINNWIDSFHSRIRVDPMDELALQFRGTAAGDAFQAAWLASGQIIERGRGPVGSADEPTPPPMS